MTATPVGFVGSNADNSGVVIVDVGPFIALGGDAIGAEQRRRIDVRGRSAPPLDGWEPAPGEVCGRATPGAAVPCFPLLSNFFR